MGIAFAGTQYLYVNSDPLVNAIPSTLAVWVWFNARNGTNFFTRCSYTDSTKYHRMVALNGPLMGELRNAAQINVQGGSLTTGGWIHTAYSIDPSSYMRVYINGAPVATPLFTSSVGTHSAFNRTSLGVLARIGGFVGYLNGKLAEAAIWNTNLADSAIAALAGGDLPSSQPTNLVAYWPLTDNSDLTDSVGSLTLTAVNSPASSDHPVMNDPAPSGAYEEIIVTSDTAKLPSSQTDFDLYVELADLSATAQAAISSDGGNVRFTADDGTTLLPRDSLLSAGAVYGWRVKVPTLAVGTVIRLYTNDLWSEPAADSTYGRHNVYAAAAYWPDGGGDDRTVNANDLTMTTATAGDSVGQVGDGTAYNGSGYGIVAANASLKIGTGNWSARAWFKTTTAAYQFILSNRNDYSGLYPDAYFRMQPDGTVLAQVASGGSDYRNAQTTGTYKDGAWHLGQVTWNAATQTLTMTVDTETVSNTATSGTVGDMDSDDNVQVAVQNHPDVPTNLFNGVLDEITWEPGVLWSANWKTARYWNEKSPSTFVSSEWISGESNSVPAIMAHYARLRRSA